MVLQLHLDIRSCFQLVIGCAEGSEQCDRACRRKRKALQWRPWSCGWASHPRFWRVSDPGCNLRSTHPAPPWELLPYMKQGSYRAISQVAGLTQLQSQPYQLVLLKSADIPFFCCAFKDCASTHPTPQSISSVLPFAWMAGKMSPTSSHSLPLNTVKCIHNNQITLLIMLQEHAKRSH